MPQILVDRSPTGGCAPAEIPNAPLVPRSLAAGSDSVLKAKKQAVEIGWNNLDSIDFRDAASIREPPGTKIPSAFCARSHVEKQLPRLASRRPRQRQIFPISSVPRRIAII